VQPARREELKRRATTLALLASFFMAGSTWHVVLSRTAFRANLIPLFTGATFYFLLRAHAAEGRKRYLWALVTGASFGLGFYSYIAYRIMVPILAVLILWPLLSMLWQKNWLAIKKHFTPLVISIATALIALIPLTHYFYTHPGSFVGRSTQVSVFNPELNQGHLLTTISEVTKQSLLGYVHHGDLNWRHNISGMPFLSPLIAPFFVIGLVLITLLAVRYVFRPGKYAQDWKYFLLTCWFWGLLIPVVTTAEGIPHGLRSIGTIPAVFIIASWGLYQTISWVDRMIAQRHWTTTGLRRWLIYYSLRVAGVCFALALILQAYFAYFVLAANTPENFYAFRSDLTPVSKYLLEHPVPYKTYLVLDKFSVQTVDYFTTVDAAHPNDPRNQPYIQVDPEDSWKLTNLAPGDRLVFAQSSFFDIKKFKQYHSASLVHEERNKFNQTVMAVYIIK
jgi:hypothetical protein